MRSIGRILLTFVIMTVFKLIATIITISAGVRYVPLPLNVIGGIIIIVVSYQIAKRIVKPVHKEPVRRY